MKHYVYVLLDTESDMKYIGMRSCDCEIDDDPYMGSSYAMAPEDKSRCDKLVLETFDTREDALAYEIKLHNQYEVHVNNEYWNLAKQTSTKFINNRKGYKLTEEHKKKCSDALKGRKMKPFTDEHRRRIAESRTGTKASEATKKKLSEQRKGDSNSNYKHNKDLTWLHTDGRVFTGKAYELTNNYNVLNTAVYKVLNGKATYACGWCLSTDKASVYAKRYKWSNGVDSYTGTCDNLKTHIGQKFCNSLKKVIRGDCKSAHGWKIIGALI